MQEARLLTTREITDLLADAASSLARDQYQIHGGHPEDIAAVMITAIEANASLMTALRAAGIVRWDQ